MNLLSPGFLLAGALLASVPIIIHLLNRRRYKEQRWAAMEFLLRAMKKNRKRLKFEQWLLLAVRCLLLGLLGLALARPTGCAEGGMAALARQSGLHVIVIDDSYSMAYDAARPGAPTHLDQAKLLARQLIDRMTPGGDAVEIVAASKPARVIFPAGYDLDAARAVIARVEQTGLSSDLPGALTLAETAAKEGAQQPARILHILSDGTRSSLTETEALTRAARAVSSGGGGSGGGYTKVWFHHLGMSDQRHAALLDIKPASALQTGRGAQTLEAAALAFGGEETRTVQWKLDDQILPGGGEVKLKDGEGGTTLVLPQVRYGRPGARVLTASLVGPDRLAIDSTRSRVVDVAEKIKVLLVEGERGGGPLGSSAAFLKIALAPPVGGDAVASRSNSPLEPDSVSDLELPSRVLSDFRVVILAGVSQIPDGVAEQLKTFVESGGVLLLFTGEAVTGENYNATLLPRGLLPGPLVKRVSAANDGGKGFRLDFRPQGNLHPMLGAFRGETRSGLDTAQIFTYWQVGAPTGAQKVERVLDYADTKDPGITVHSLGQGRVVFVSTSAGADGWTSLPAKPVFVALVHEMIASSLTSRDGWMNVDVGGKLELPATLKLARAPVLTDAAGRTFPLASETFSPPPSPSSTTAPSASTTVWRSDTLTKPGVYILQGVAGGGGGTGESSLPIAVNVDAKSESDIRTVDEAGLRKALGDINMEVVRDALPLETVAADERRADYGWILMLALLGFVGTESLLAMRFGHNAK